jgi:Sulfocyanin (SoxE) domain
VGVLRRSTTGVILFVTILLAATACGKGSVTGGVSSRTSVTQQATKPQAPAPSLFLAVDAPAHSVTITLIAAYDGYNSGFNFDGYSRELMWTVPRGWDVHVVCKNRGPLRHSCAVVQGAGTTRLAFPGAATPQPQIGLEAGTTASFTFRATATGVYRFVCLVPGHEAARMWDVLKIVPRGKPSAVDLRAP